MGPASRALPLLALLVGAAACGRAEATVETGAGASPAAAPGPPPALAAAADELDCGGRPVVGTTRQHAAPAAGARRTADVALAERLGRATDGTRPLDRAGGRRVAVDEGGRTVLVLGLEELTPGYWVVAEELECDG